MPTKFKDIAKGPSGTYIHEKDFVCRVMVVIVVVSVAVAVAVAVGC